MKEMTEQNPVKVRSRYRIALLSHELDVLNLTGLLVHRTDGHAL